MRASILQHVPFEGPAFVARWLADNGIESRTIHVYRGEDLPPLQECGLLVVLGGPMSVNDVDDHPWLGGEIALIREAIDAGRAVLGICLGAQLIARALGAAVRPCAEREVGWFEVVRDPLSDPADPFGLPDRFTALHWHGEECELAPGCIRMASTEACANQLFRLGDTVLGIQCHLEFRPESVTRLAEHCPADLAPGPWVQDEAAMLRDPAAFDRANELMASLLDRIVADQERPGT